MVITKGWLFDAYPLCNKMVFWIKQENGDTIRLEDDYWSHSIYVASDYINNKSEFEKLITKQQQQEGNNNNNTELIKDYELVSKYERITDTTRSDILKLNLSDSTKVLALARRI